MSVFSINGVRLHKRMQVKIFPPAGKTRTIKLRAPAGKWITAEGIDRQLGQVAEGIEKAWPWHEFRMVPIGPSAFNFVCAGEKKIDSELTTTEREVVTSTPLPSTTGGSEAAFLPQALPWPLPDACLDGSICHGAAGRRPYRLSARPLPRNESGRE